MRLLIQETLNRNTSQALGFTLIELIVSIGILATVAASFVTATFIVIDVSANWADDANRH